MKIGIIGSGNIGANLGKLWADAGHEVFYSFSRSEDKLRQLAAEAGDGARWGAPAEAVAFADVILLAPPYPALDAALKAAGSMNGKIVIDAVNPFTDKGPAYADKGTAAEEVAAKLPSAKTVKAYNHIWYQHIATRHHANPPLTAFISGDDAEAKSIVKTLVEDTGFYVWDLGALRTARWTEPHGALFNKPMTQAEAAEIVPTLTPI
jgi:hypothetical protein